MEMLYLHNVVKIEHFYWVLAMETIENKSKVDSHHSLSVVRVCCLLFLVCLLHLINIPFFLALHFFLFLLLICAFITFCFLHTLYLRFVSLLAFIACSCLLAGAQWFAMKNTVDQQKSAVRAVDTGGVSAEQK